MEALLVFFETSPISAFLIGVGVSYALVFLGTIVGVLAYMTAIAIAFWISDLW